MALERFASWVLINKQRVARRGWSFWGSGAESAPASPSVSLFRALVQRNRFRSHRRYLRTRSLSLQTNVIWWNPQMMKRSRRRCLAATWTYRSTARCPSQAWVFV